MVARWPAPVLALLLAGVLAAAWSAPRAASARPFQPNPGAACSLTPTQEVTAVLAFDEMIPVIRHPRCMNCHGGVNPLVPYAEGGHMGGFIDTTKIANSSVQTIRKVCNECHNQIPVWDTPGPPMLWVGKSDKQICMDFKRFSNDPADFIGHITDEHGLSEFIDAAYKGERALDDDSKTYGAQYGKPFAVDRPPGSRADLIRQGTQWANTVGPKGWSVTPDCGCEIHKDGWVGTASAVVIMPSSGYSVEERATASVWFELDTKGVRDEYWRSTAGSIHWTVKYTGQCVGTFSGTTPISTMPSGLGGDGNPIGIIALTPDNGQMRYSVSTAPWQDQYYPFTTVPCGTDPPLQVPLPQFMSFWWTPDPTGELASPDGRLLQGSYTKQVGQGTMQWSWSFRRTAP